MRYVFLGHFTVYGSGYADILENLAYGLVDRGHEVKILGVGYHRNPHNYPFSVVPMEVPWMMEALLIIPTEWNADRVIIAMDIPYLNDIAIMFTEKEEKEKLWNFEALYPVESCPIRSDWIKSLGNYKRRYAISQFGTNECNASGIPTSYLPMGCKVGTMPTDKNQVREKIGWPTDKAIFLTVADNQERKALPLAIEAFSKLDKDQAEYFILTDPFSRKGWRFIGEDGTHGLLSEYGVEDSVHIVPYGIDVGTLSMMYWSADALVVPSQAEGACMPILEATSHGLPVICGEWTALEDYVGEKWAFTVGYDYVFRHPWGNVKRWFASVDQITKNMESIILMRGSKQYEDIQQCALDYARSRKWEYAVDVIEKR